MPNYANGKIYTIRSHQTDKIYIGSTTQTLSRRLAKHKSKYKCWKNGAKDKTSSFEILQYDDYYIELLEEFPCHNKMELNKQEGFHIRENKDICVNCVIPCRTGKEYYVDNKIKILQRMAQYQINNKENIIKKRAQYYQNNKEKIAHRNAQCRQDNKEKISHRNAQYYKDNKEKFAKYNDKYYHNNKEKISMYYQANKKRISEQDALRYKKKKAGLKQKFTCKCGAYIQVCSTYNHYNKSKKHKRWVETNEMVEVSNDDFDAMHSYI